MSVAITCYVRKSVTFGAKKGKKCMATVTQNLNGDVFAKSPQLKILYWSRTCPREMACRWHCFEMSSIHLEFRKFHI